MSTPQQPPLRRQRWSRGRDGQGMSPRMRARQAALPFADIAPNDPLITYFLSTPGAVELERITLDSPALAALKAAGVKLVIPLINQGELIGLLNLGARLSQQDYSSADRALLNTLATQVAPALRVAELVREQRAQARERERVEQEMRVARLIQQTLLPKELPALPGWQIAAYYQPARAVGGDFYDFMTLDDGRLGIVIGDVTDKGVPAALVMATTRSILRAAMQGNASPGRVLEQTNDLLYPDIPAKMFVTCLYAILDPGTGRLHFANAGHDLPFLRQGAAVTELRATGMPLGLMPGMQYEEKEVFLMPEDTLLFYSDGLAEAHNPVRELFGFPAVGALLATYDKQQPLIDVVLGALEHFTGSDWEQEDDVTLVTVQCSDSTSNAGEWRVLDEWVVPTVPGNERMVMERTDELARATGLNGRRLEQLATAVAEATMNAMEHGNHFHPDRLVTIQMLASPTTIAVHITDQGGGTAPATMPEPDIDAKIAGLQSPRGWGLFLIKNLVDDMRVSGGANGQTIELMMRLQGDDDDITAF